jgi:hypothetical protein
MHEVVAQHASRSTPVNDLFHQARELISAVAEQVMPVAVLVAKARDLELEEKPAKEGDAWRRKVIATTLGLEEHIVGVWQSLTLHKYAHRDRVHGVRRLTQGLRDEAFRAGRYIDVLRMGLLREEMIDARSAPRSSRKPRARTYAPKSARSGTIP